MSKAKNHKELVAEIRRFHQFLKKEAMEALLEAQVNLYEAQAVLKKTPDTQFRYGHIAKAIEDSNKALNQMIPVMNSMLDAVFDSINIVRQDETEENNASEMQRKEEEDVE